MREADKKARAAYEYEINIAYYTSGKFAKNVAKEAVSSGFKMGTRQMMGLILAEIWFELKDAIPELYKKNKQAFTVDQFIKDLTTILKDIWSRIQKKFKDFFVVFKDTAIAGVFSSVNTTLMNIFFTTQKRIIKMIREIWVNLVQAIKLIFFNPESLPLGQLLKEVCKIIGAGIAVSCGVMVNTMLAQVCMFPFGPEVAAFCSALTTGIITLGVTYYLENGEMCQKIWKFLDRFSDNGKTNLKFYQSVNKELDDYLTRLYQLEFNVDPQELEHFSIQLSYVNSELERQLVLKGDIERRNILLPFELGNPDSIKGWLE